MNLDAPRTRSSPRGSYEEYHPYGTAAWWAGTSGLVSQKRLAWGMSGHSLDEYSVDQIGAELLDAYNQAFADAKKAGIDTMDLTMVGDPRNTVFTKRDGLRDPKAAARYVNSLQVEIYALKPDAIDALYVALGKRR